MKIVQMKLTKRLGDKKDLSKIPGLYLPGQTSRSESGYIKNLSDIPLLLPDVHLPFGELKELILGSTLLFTKYMIKPVR